MKLLRCEWAKLNTCKIHLLMAASDTYWVHYWANAALLWAQVNQDLMDVCLKQAFPKIWIFYSKNMFSISHDEFWGLSSLRQQLSVFLKNWQEALWVLSVLPSCLHRALPSGPLLSLWSLAVTVMLLPPWLEASLLSMPFHPGSHISLFTGAASEHTWSLF